jgi:hypothetical protein
MKLNLFVETTIFMSKQKEGNKEELDRDTDCLHSKFYGKSFEFLAVNVPILRQKVFSCCTFHLEAFFLYLMKVLLCLFMFHLFRLFS